MSYATADELEVYIAANEVVELPDAPLVEALLEASSRDLDRLLAPVPERAAAGLKLDPDDLSEHQRSALSRACCAECEWRLMMGEDELAGAEDGISSAAGVSFTPVPRPPAPKAAEEMSGFGLPVRSGTVAPPEDEAEADTPAAP